MPLKQCGWPQGDEPALTVSVYAKRAMGDPRTHGKSRLSPEAARDPRSGATRRNAVLINFGFVPGTNGESAALTTNILVHAGPA